jgi:hypothetical protein
MSDCFYSLENRLIDTAVSGSVTTLTNTYPIRILIKITSSLMDRRSYWPLAQTHIYGIIKKHL